MVDKVVARVAAQAVALLPMLRAGGTRLGHPSLALADPLTLPAAVELVVPVASRAAVGVVRGAEVPGARGTM